MSLFSTCVLTGAAPWFWPLTNLVGPYGMTWPAEGRAFQRGDDLGAVGAAGALDRVGEQQDAGIVHVDFVGVELVLRLDLLLQRQRLRVLRIEPVIAVHDVLRGLREFLDELVGRGGAAEHRVDALRPDALLLHGARQQHVFVVVVGRNDDVRIVRPDLQRDVVEVAGRRRMRDGLEHLEAALRQLRVQELGEARAERRVLVHDHHGLRGLAGLLVDGHEIVERGLGDHAEARTEPERVLQAAGDDAVDHADVDDIGQVVARGGLARGEADAAGIAADDGGDAGRVHLLDLGVAAVRRRLRVAEHRLDLRAAERLDAARRVDLLDRDLRADPALLAGIGQRAGHRMQHADLDGRALRAQHGRGVQRAATAPSAVDCRNRRRLTVENRTRHACLPWVTLPRKPNTWSGQASILSSDVRRRGMKGGGDGTMVQV